MLACVLLPEGRTDLTRRLFAVSPLVEGSGDASDPLAFLDLRGLGRLHRNAPGVFAAVRTALAPLSPRGMAVASNRFTAEVAARHAPRPVMVAPGEEALFQSRLPLSALPMSAALARRLAPLGLQTLGDFASLPCNAVERRYGPEGVALHRLARGEDSAALVPQSEPGRLSVWHELQPPAEALERVRPMLEASLEQLASRLQSQARGVTRLAVRWHRVDGGEVVHEVAPASPEDRAALLLDLVLAKLEGAPPGGPVSDVALEVLASASTDVHQNTLFGEAERDASRRAEALSRLETLLGKDTVVRPRLRRAHRVEQRWTLERSDPEAPPPRRARASGPQADAVSVGGTGVVLRWLPEPEELVAVRAGGRTVAFRRGRRTLEVALARGPRRLSGGWWEQPYERDEYDIQTPEGAVYRVCRDHLRERWLLLAEMD